MSPSACVRRGADELRRLLAGHTFDLRTLDTAGFRRWLERHLARWERDPVFVQRTRIRELRRVHPRLRALEDERRRAAAADRASPLFDSIHRAEHELKGTGQAVAGLGAAFSTAAPEERPRLERKLDAFRARRAALRAEMEELVRSSEARRTLDRLTDELSRLRAEIGLDREEARLRQLLRARGRHTGHRGAGFEELALAVTREHVVPELPSGEGDAGEVRVLRGVTLGAARTEIDQLVVRAPARPGEAAEVLALVEVKRNLNDLAHGLRRRRENLAWLTGDADGYDPAAYRTRSFPAGHFDRPATHEDAGETFRFDRDSFRRLRPGPAGDAAAPDGLYFVTRAGTVWGLSTAALARVGHRVATDERWSPESDEYLGGLLEWCRSLADAVETPDVLRAYAATEERARRILVVSRD